MTSRQVSVLTGPSLLALVLLALLIVAERVGLPPQWVRMFFLATMLLTLATILWLSGTTREEAFMGRNTALEPIAGGMLLSVVTSIAVSRLLPAYDPVHWLAGLIGMPVGLVQRQHANTETSGAGLPLLKGVALLLVGAGLVLIGLAEARVEFSRLLLAAPATVTGGDGTPWLALLLIPGVALIAFFSGGIFASLRQAALLALLVAGALALMVAIGLVQFGTLPLIGQAETRTLLAIAEARNRWGITAPLHFLAWPDGIGVLKSPALQHLAASALVSAGLALALAPALPLRRKTTAAVAVSGVILLPLAVMAVAGYAIEAAASTFLGAAIARPPAALVEAARFGLIGVCGGNPETADAVRLACGVAPRDSATFAWGQIMLTPAFVASGLPAATGYSATLSMAAGLLNAAWLTAMIALGLALASLGLGRDIMARHHHAAGLASLRLGLTRLAAVILAVAMILLPGMAIPNRAIILTAFCVGCVLIVAIAVWQATNQRQQTALPDAPSPPPRRRPRKASSAGGETA
jgi:hypothetical protein